MRIDGNVSDFIAGGFILEHGTFEPCTVICESGVAKVEHTIPDRCDFKALFIKDMVNVHTHCGDYGLDVKPGMTLEELVAPPDGLKHRYLAELTDDCLKDNISRFDGASASYGSASFIDFREGGVEGCRMLRACSKDAVILGRPVSKEYDPQEIHDILEVADGIGLPSISDMPMSYIESVADDVRRERKIFSIHASERVREDIDSILSLDPAFVVHMCEATDGDLAKCAEAEVPIAVCPTSNGYFGKQSPVGRMIDNGVDIGLGTDNGMLCEPDLVSEASKLSKILTIQGYDPNEAWKALSNFGGKLLYRTKQMEEGAQNSYLTVIPSWENGMSERGPERAFRAITKRGVD